MTKRHDIVFNNIMQEFEQFLTSSSPNGYVRCGQSEVYVRKGFHHLSGQIVQCLDIANINILPSLRNKGLGMRIIANMHNASPFDVTFVENILNDNLYDALVRRGWEDTSTQYDRRLMKRK